MDGTVSPQLKDKVDEIKEHLAKAEAEGWRLNEADTERVIIFPLLAALGYGPLDIRQRGHDSVANNFPNYTLLPGTPQKWFLEVKKLDLSLQDGEAAQTVNYANNQGAEWAVLTNGRRWYIYNAHLPKPLTEKRVFQIDNLFADTAALKTLTLLSRSSMLADILTQAWTFDRIQRLIRAQLETPNSIVRKRLRQIAAEETNAPVSDALIEQAIRSLAPILSTVTGNEFGPGSIPLLEPSVSPSVTNQAAYTYAEIVGDYARFNNKQPKALYLGSGSIIPVGSWKQANEMATEYLCRQYGLPPLPFPKPDSHGACFINNSPAYTNGQPFKAYYSLQIGVTTVYVNRYVTVFSVKRQVSRLFEAIGAPMDVVKVIIE